MSVRRSTRGTARGTARGSEEEDVSKRARVEIITNENIRGYVSAYIHSRGSLPAYLRDEPIGSWDVTGVTNMSKLFEGQNTFDEPLGTWNVTNVTNMQDMFSGCSTFNQSLT